MDKIIQRSKKNIIRGFLFAQKVFSDFLVYNDKLNLRNIIMFDGLGPA